MTRAEQITVSVAVRALKSGAPGQQVAQFLQAALLDDGPVVDVDELLRPGGTP